MSVDSLPNLPFIILPFSTYKQVHTQCHPSNFFVALVTFSPTNTVTTGYHTHTHTHTHLGLTNEDLRPLPLATNSTMFVWGHVVAIVAGNPLRTQLFESGQTQLGKNQSQISTLFLILLHWLAQEAMHGNSTSSCTQQNKVKLFLLRGQFYKFTAHSHPAL